MPFDAEPGPKRSEDPIDPLDFAWWQTERQTRIAALDFAIRLAPEGVNPKKILSVAKEFYDFIDDTGR